MQFLQQVFWINWNHRKFEEKNIYINDFWISFYKQTECSKTNKKKYSRMIAQGNENNWEFNVNKNPTDATVCRYLFTAKLLYIFRVSQHPSSGVLKTVPAASGTGHTTCTRGCGYRF